jgi:hypothetical protein
MLGDIQNFNKLKAYNYFIIFSCQMENFIETLFCVFFLNECVTHYVFVFENGEKYKKLVPYKNNFREI